jgi:dCMP deaminase
MPAPDVDWDQRFLELAQQVATWSKDPSTKVGSVIVDAKRRVLAVGYNGFPRGVQDDPATLANRDQKLALTVHSEMNAILNSGAMSRLEGATLYATLYPCNECAKAIVQAGITRVVTYKADNVRWKVAHEIASDIFSQAGVEVTTR